MRVSIFIAICLLLTACSINSETERYARLVEQWQGREIVLPEVMTDVMTGDTIDLSDADFTILTYVDSAGCTSCKMKLPLWNEFMNGIDSLMHVNVNLITIVNTTDKRILSSVIRCDSFDYPVILDSLEVIKNLISFLEVESLNTCLLNRDYKIIAIGNPIINTNIAKLYRDIISGNKLFDPTGKRYANIDNACVFVGNIHIGDTVIHTFHLRNNGHTTLFIEKTLCSCQCMNVTLSATKISPNEEVAIETSFIENADYDSTNVTFEKTVQIYFKGLNIPAILSIQGYVLK